MTERGYGCLPTTAAEKAAAPVHPAALSTAVLPSSVDLRFTGFMPSIWDQGQLGSCTAHGSGAAYSYELARQKGAKNFTPARLFIYFNSRSLENATAQDAGASIADAGKALNKWGAPPEADWPYDISRYAVHPPSKAYLDGETRTALRLSIVPQAQQAIMSMLASGVPVIIGIAVYTSFETPQPHTGAIPHPNKATETLEGYHCVLAVGYTSWGVIIRNSWGTSWGAAGYAILPWSYVLDPEMAFDFWAVTLVGTGIAAKTADLFRRTVAKVRGWLPWR